MISPVSFGRLVKVIQEPSTMEVARKLVKTVNDSSNTSKFAKQLRDTFDDTSKGELRVFEFNDGVYIVSGVESEILKRCRNDRDLDYNIRWVGIDKLLKIRNRFDTRDCSLYYNNLFPNNIDIVVK